MCIKEGEEKGALGILVTTPLEGATRLEEAGGWTTRLLGDKGVVDALGLGVPTRVGGTPPANMAEVGVEIPSLELAITLLMGTPITGEVIGRTWMITGSFNSVRGGLKFLANSSAYKYSISTTVVST